MTGLAREGLNRVRYGRADETLATLASFSEGNMKQRAIIDSLEVTFYLLASFSQRNGLQIATLAACGEVCC